MNRPGIVPADVYPLYCDYIRQVNRSSRLGRERFSDVSIVSQADFQAIWNALSEPRRRLWQWRFEAGHDEVAKLERCKLVVALTSNGSDQIEFNAVREGDGDTQLSALSAGDSQFFLSRSGTHRLRNYHPF